MSSGDPFDLQRFVAAQSGVYQTVLRELRAARKESHWIWFIFPQMRGLGYSSTAHHFGITSLSEAHAFLAHPILGPRLDECTRIVLDCSGRSLHQIFGTPDDLKFCSSMTLFDVARPDADFGRALDRWCSGKRDERTLALIEASSAHRAN